MPSDRFREIAEALAGFELFVVGDRLARPLADAVDSLETYGDFEAVRPLLEPERRRWLAEALERVHPGHRWLPELT